MLATETLIVGKHYRRTQLRDGGWRTHRRAGRAVRHLGVLLVVLLGSLQAWAGDGDGSSAAVISVRPLHADVFDTLTRHRAVYPICTVVSVDAGRHTWLTAAHCVSPGGDRYLVSAWSIDAHAVVPVRTDHTRDLALLVTADYAIPALALASEAPDYEDVLDVIGYPLASPSPVLSRGSLVSPDTLLHVECNLDATGRQRSYMVSTAAVWPGSSGGAIINAGGHLVGIVQIGCRYDHWPVSGGSPYAQLVDFLRGT